MMKNKATAMKERKIIAMILQDGYEPSCGLTPKEYSKEHPHVFYEGEEEKYEEYCKKYMLKTSGKEASNIE